MDLITRDYDQSGLFRTAQKVWQGPSLGWVLVEGAVIEIGAAIDLRLPLGIALVRVNVAGAVTIELPSAKSSPAGPGAQPSSSVWAMLTVMDVGGFAAASPITINALSGETIDGEASVAIATAFGSITLRPNITTGLWTII